MLTVEDMDAAQSIWEEWAAPGYTLDVIVIGDHSPATMDPDRPLGAVVKASLSLRLQVQRNGRVEVVVDCPYQRDALLATVGVLGRRYAS